jgi:hypothetical protein
MMKATTGLSCIAVLGAAACGGPPPCDTSVPGSICTIAGNGENQYYGDDGPALDAAFSLPMDSRVGPDGDLYVLDWNNHRIRKISFDDGIIRHVAGRGELGGTLDDPANNDFNHPTGLLFGPDGDRLYIAAWHNSKIRTVDIDTLEVVDQAGTGGRSYFGDGGPALDAVLDLPASIAWSPEGELVIMDQANQVMRRIDQEGVIHRMAGQCVIEPPEGCGEEELTQCPGGSGKLTCDETLCGSPCTPGYGGDGGPATEMRISQPFGQSADPAGKIVYDEEGNLIFADTRNHIIRMIDNEGQVSTIAGTPPVDGAPQSGYAGDGGPATEALLYNPVDVALGDDGTLYFTDVYNHCVRAVDPEGVIRTAAGVCGEPGYAGDDGPADEALLKRPYGLEVADGVMYIADTGNNVFRQVTLP